MSEADAEDRRLADQFAHLRASGPSRGSGSPGPFDRNTPSGLQRQHIFGCCVCRNNRHARARLHQLPQDVPLDAEVIGDHVQIGLPAHLRFARTANTGSTPLVPLIALGVVETRLARSRPAIEGEFRARSTSSAGSPPTVDNTPRMTPRVRRWRTRRRVSISLMIGTSYCVRK